MSISITDSAKAQISHLCLEKKTNVRLMIASGGCQGFNKVWELSNETFEDDSVFDTGNGTKLVIDAASVDILKNAIIDYKKDLSGSYFSIDIPNAVSTCGCGTSFSI